MSGCFNSEPKACLVPRVVVEQIERVDKRLSSWEDKIKYFDKVFSEYREVLIKDIDGVQENFAEINKRIATLEENYRDLFHKFNYLDERIKKIEETIRLHAHAISYKSKQPHKCPVCGGNGKKYIDPSTPLSGFEAMLGHKDINGISYLVCNPCEGKGIVWTP